MGLKILGAGFGRTGTHSLHLALNELGFGPCYHMFHVAENKDHQAVWLRAFEGESVGWRELFRGFQSAVDWPAAVFVGELLEQFPDAKVILTLRDPEEWYRSMSSTIFPALVRESRVMRMLDPSKENAISEMILNRVFSGRYNDRDFVLKAYEDNVRNVQELVPGHALLKYQVSDGWGPLCDFLGVPVPDRPFPRSNDTQSFRSRHPSQQQKQ